MWISRKRKLHDYLAANNVELIKALIKVVNYHAPKGTWLPLNGSPD